MEEDVPEEETEELELEVDQDEYHSLTTSPISAEKSNRPATDPRPMNRMIKHHLNQRVEKSATVSETSAL